MISVIIPTLNEAKLLPDTLQSLAANSSPMEVIVVDAESTDNTVSMASKNGAHVIHSPIRQRAGQMNLGATQAVGDIFLFLHADTLVAATALEAIECALENPDVAGGSFVRRYDHPSRFLKITCRLADWRSSLCGMFLGDQGIFARKDIFTRLGGFSDRDDFEDLDFSRRLARAGKVVTLRPPVISSGRRFGGRPVIRTFQDFLLTCRYLYTPRKR